MRRIGRKKKAKPLTPKVPAYTLIPAVGICAFLLLWAVWAVPTTIPLSVEERWYVPNTAGAVTDICLRGREILLFVTAVLLILYWLGERIFPDAPPKARLLNDKSARLPLILCGAYLLFAAASCIFAEYKSTCFLGIASENEGLASTIGCVVLLLAAFSFFTERNLEKTLGRAVFALSGVIAVMFIIERVSLPLMQLVFGYTDERAGTALLFGNSAGCGAVCAMLFPAAMAFTLSESRTVLKLIRGAAAGCLLDVVVCSFSSAAFYGALLGGTVLVALCFLKKHCSAKNAAVSAAAAVLPVAVLFLCDISAAGYLGADLRNTGAYSPEDSFMLEEISADGDSLHLKGADGEFTIVLEGEIAIFLDGQQNELARADSGQVQVSEHFSAEIGERMMVISLGYDEPIAFETSGGRFQYIG
ncbi:MAG: hypothetical protein ACI4Q4_05070, partial [Oscillospiraceae bacterium]